MTEDHLLEADISSLVIITYYLQINLSLILECILKGNALVPRTGLFPLCVLRVYLGQLSKVKLYIRKETCMVKI